MAHRRKSVKKIKETIRLHEAGLNKKQIAGSVTTSRKSVRKYIERVESLGLTYTEIEKMTPKQLYARLFPVKPEDGRGLKPRPDWQIIYNDMKKKSVTLALLWEEYIDVYPDGYRYSQFCHNYGLWRKKLDISMRQDHKAGEKLFVDFAGQTIPVTNPATGQIKQAQIFVATMGASNYSYGEATWTQTLPDWIQCHVNAFSFFGGCVELVVPDNLKSGVSKACRRISSHVRSFSKGHHTTILEHLPKSHREDKQWTPSRIISWAKNFGENTGLVVEKIIEIKEHPVLGYRSSLGIIRLEKSYGRERLEAASKRAVAFGAYSYQSIKSILEKGLDKKSLQEESNKNVPQNHENVRGSVYYQSQEEKVC